MRKVLLGLLSCMVASSAHAVPTGCFKQDYSGFCYSGYFYPSDCNQWNMTSYNFGNYISSMCSYINSAETANATLSSALSSCEDTAIIAMGQRDACTSARDSYLNQLNSCITAGTSIEADRKLWISYAKKRDALVKKLYRACGAKCKKIK
jgi:hypothetical protein